MSNLILLADNNKDYLETAADFLRNEGFKVITASNPTETKRILEQQNIDLAVLDVRLVNDDDEKDTSGLDLAKSIAPLVPKVILTRFPSVEHVREAIGPGIDGLPVAADYVDKRDGLTGLLTTIRKVLRLQIRFQEVFDESDGRIMQVGQGYKDAQAQSILNYRVSILVAVVGIAIIFAGVCLTMAKALAVGIPSVVAGVIAEAISVLFFTRVDKANKRMDRYHRQLLQSVETKKRLADILAGCGELSTIERRESCKEKALETAMRLWLHHLENHNPR